MRGDREYQNLISVGLPTIVKTMEIVLATENLKITVFNKKMISLQIK
jgi:hypothetical protein